MDWHRSRIGKVGRLVGSVVGASALLAGCGVDPVRQVQTGPMSGGGAGMPSLPGGMSSAGPTTPFGGGMPPGAGWSGGFTPRGMPSPGGMGWPGGGAALPPGAGWSGGVSPGGMGWPGGGGPVMSAVPPPVMSAAPAYTASPEFQEYLRDPKRFTWDFNTWLTVRQLERGPFWWKFMQTFRARPGTVYPPAGAGMGVPPPFPGMGR